MKKVFPMFLFLVLSVVVIGCDDIKEPKEPASHRVEGWEETRHWQTVQAESIYSCNQCHASPVDRQPDCVDGGCHTISPRLIPLDHNAVGGVVGEAYKTSHQTIPENKVANSRPYCVACHTITKTATKNCGCHAFGVSALMEAEKMGIGEPILE